MKKTKMGHRLGKQSRTVEGEMQRKAQMNSSQQTRSRRKPKGTTRNKRKRTGELVPSSRQDEGTSLSFKGLFRCLSYMKVRCHFELIFYIFKNGIGQLSFYNIKSFVQVPEEK